ncbi:MAG TPA: DUF3466 family protein [Tepidisphaeraceae bacterium]|jgi:probable HAF family extracellular repeat protein|nr:DUF3466 family protein [Tepidisphaeraceae bacterium]
MRTASVISAAIVMASAAILSAAPIQYGVADLGGLGGSTGSKAYGISSSNLVAGSAYTSANATISALTFDSSGSPVVRTQYMISGGSSSQGMAIGGASAHPNTVVGFSTISTHLTHAFAGQGSATDIHSLVATGAFTGSLNSRAFGINSNDDVVGQASIGSNYQAFYLPGAGGSSTAIPMLSGSYTNSLASAVNASGNVVGFDYTGSWTYSLSGTVAGGATHPLAFTWTSSGGVVSLGTLGGTDSIATSINSVGTIVGQSTRSVLDPLSTKGHAFIYSGGLMSPLTELSGATESIADDIDDNGDIVGSVMVGGASKAFLYSGGTMFDLNTLLAPTTGWTLEEATSINDDGYIAGYGLHNGVTTAFLLSPIGHGPVVPEPTSVVMLGLGAIGLVAKRRH